MDSSVQGELSSAAKSGAVWRDVRRILAIKMHERGCSQEAIAELLEVSQASVSLWLQRYRAGGVAGLARRPGSGPHPRLTLEHKAELLTILQGGAQAAGFEGDIWTCQRVAQVIEREWGVHYHPSHVSLLLRQLGLSPQKPALRAMQRDEPAIERWVTERWPQIQAQARQEGRTVGFIDESGVYPLPQVVRTYAPRGQTPVLKHGLTRLHWSVISAITPSGELSFRISDFSITGEEIVEFLAWLPSQIEGPLWVLWDGASIHKSRLVEEFLSSDIGQRLKVERLPPYASELNPDEGVWANLKNKLKNICFDSMLPLKYAIQEKLQQLAAAPATLLGILAQSPLY
jgi:transposase